MKKNKYILKTDQICNHRKQWSRKKLILKKA